MPGAPSATFDLSIVVPMYCEESNIEALVERVCSACRPLPVRWELVLVDDGSTDRTLELSKQLAAREPEVVVVELVRNFGQHAAVLAGFSSARGCSVITLDADLQNPPEEIPRIYELLKEGHEVVHTYRIEREDVWLRRWASRTTNRMARWLGGSGISDYGCMLRGYSREVALACVASNDRGTFIPALAERIAGSPVEIGVAHEARAAGESKYSPLKLVSLQLDLITSLSVRPLRLLTTLGFLFAMGGFGVGITLIIFRLFFGVKWANEGTLTILGIVAILSGVQLIATGVVGEYIGRIHERLRGQTAFRIRSVSTTESPVEETS